MKLSHPSSIVKFQFGSNNLGPSGNLFGFQTQTLTREREQTVQKEVQKELEDTIYEFPDPSRLELGDVVLNSLSVEADDVSDQKFVEKKQEEDTALEQIKHEYNFDEIKDGFDEAIVPHLLDFFFRGDNENFVQAVGFCPQAQKIENLLHF